ncbi:hypothetical protein F441_07546 [Phytophthora nicotianae CJ01A1]|uniref:Uncharacterized protein n=2 Tax=Phytophthora nicotianae TaxID=4792 RepID=W2J7X1_PHYNI|nr:hypothetical protein L915_07393 [Phytophthora nicotianae]ETL41738.1 hypothetical protein L916_07335 [Phytophthora nicotianae]ETP18192.1 hypothetical protein F441_07546 [Phytophthora nicotianae CJ01A1]
MAKEKGMSVRDALLDMVKDKKCGFTRMDVDPQPIPSDGNAKWRSNRDGGFGHLGPCEVYIDDNMVARGDNCETDFPGGDDKSSKPSIIPAYINCIPLQGSSSKTQTKPSAGSAGGEELPTEGSKNEENPPPANTQPKQESSNSETTPEAAPEAQSIKCKAPARRLREKISTV